MAIGQRFMVETAGRLGRILRPGLVAIVILAGLGTAACGGEAEILEPQPAHWPDADPSPPHHIAPKWGFVAFPFDVTVEAWDELHDLILPESDIYGVQLDLLGCLPWREVIDGEPFPHWLQAEFENQKARIPRSHAVFLAVTPTTQSRVDMLPQCGDVEGSTAPMPPSLRGKPYDDLGVIDAFIRWTDRVTRFFEADYLNVGVEISELSVNAPERWHEFETLYMFVYIEMKQRHPDLAIGPEMAMQSLLLDRVADQVSPIVDVSDFLGISFYPYGSEFGEVHGLPALPPPPAQWREPLAFLETFTDTPIAILQTGYTTRNVVMNDPVTLHFPGNERLQAKFLRDLVTIAHRDSYLFVIWFVPVDYTRLSEAGLLTEDFQHIWEFAGLFDKNLAAKPAWRIWRNRGAPDWWDD